MTGPWSTAMDSAREYRRVVGAAVFGDRLGLTLFLGCLCVFGVYWRAGPFITDTATLVATLDALTAGQLWIDRAGESTFSAPGAVVHDGRIYGRNYGQVLTALPLVLVLDAIAVVADLRVGLTALWHLALLGFVIQLAGLIEQRRAVTVGGSILVLGSFVTNLIAATQFVDVSRPLLALQLSTMLAAGLLATGTYRLVAWRYDRTSGLLTGAGAVLVLPVGLWAGLPKRHVLVALLLVGILYAFARSRTESVDVSTPYVGEVPGFRALSYVFVGLIAWIHAGEAVFVLMALVAVDLPTAPANDRRTLALLAGALALSLTPTLLTNLLISHNPLVPPRLLEPASGTAQTGGMVSGGVRTPASTGYETPIDLSALPRPIQFVATVVVGGLGGLTEFDRLYHTWIRSGSTEYIAQGNAAFAGANHTVLESVPLFGALVAVVLSSARILRGGLRDALGRFEATDVLALAITAVFVLMYTPRLPTHVQLSVRYLLPTYPLLLYLVVRTASVRGLLSTQLRLVGWTYAAGVLLGTQVVLATVVIRGRTVAGAIQLHARLGVVLAAVLVATLLLAAIDDRARPLAAVALGLAAAAGTAFIVLSGLAYFSFIGEFVLPLADRLADGIGRI